MIRNVPSQGEVGNLGRDDYLFQDIAHLPCRGLRATGQRDEQHKTDTGLPQKRFRSRQFHCLPRELFHAVGFPSTEMSESSFLSI